MFKAVIFDFDGVIADSELLHFRSFNAILKQYDVHLTKEVYYRDYLGYTDVDCYKAVARDYGVEFDDETIVGMVEQKAVIFEKLLNEGGKIIEGVREFLSLLEENNIRRAICSGALLSEIRLILTQGSLDHYFETIVAAEHVSIGKPDPQGFLLTLARLNDKDSEEEIKTDECVVIEDSHWGLEAAKQAGMHTVAVTNTYAADELGKAEKVISHLSELSIEDLQSLCN